MLLTVHFVGGHHRSFDITNEMDADDIMYCISQGHNAWSYSNKKGFIIISKNVTYVTYEE